MELMIPRWLFDERKTIAINLPFSNKNEHFSEKFCEKFEFHTNGKAKFNIIWATRKIIDNFKHLSCVTYQGICSCGNNYIGETIRNTVSRTDEHEQPNCKSEPSKHLKKNPGHKFDWMISVPYKQRGLSPPPPQNQSALSPFLSKMNFFAFYCPLVMLLFSQHTYSVKLKHFSG